MASRKLRIVPLGGLGEIGKNMMSIEYGRNILIVDGGIMFPENDMLGVDFIIPDFNYLLDKKDRVRAILVTHGHEDHTGALPYILREIQAPIYATRLTKGLIEIKLRSAKLQDVADVRLMEAGDRFTLGPFTIEPFHVCHSIPDSVGLGITTPVGLIVHSGDYKFDHTPVDGRPPDFAKLAEFAGRGVLALLADSTNADKPGWTPSEAVIDDAFDRVFREAPGRIIVATFASLISRVQQVANAAQRHGRKLAIAGHTMLENVKMARSLGYLEIPQELLIDLSQVNRLPPRQVAIMATGTQGEPTAVLGRLALGRHRHLRIQEGDTVVMSAHPIPGNEEMVHRIINRLFQRGANVLYDPIAPVHVSGHASQEEQKLLINLIRPRFFIPIHGELRHLKQHALMAQELGIPPDRIAVVENGTVIELDEKTMTIGDRVPGGYVFVDGSGVGDIGPAVIRDREMLAEEGFVIVVVPVDARTRRPLAEPEILSRGFVYLREAGDLLENARTQVMRLLRQNGNRNRDELQSVIQNTLSKFFYNETRRRPMTFAVVVEIEPSQRHQERG